MYKEIDRHTAIDLYLEDMTVYSIDPNDLDDNQYMSLRPLEDCYIEDLKSPDIRYIVDIQEEDTETESKEEYPLPGKGECFEKTGPVLEGFKAYENEVNEPKGKAGRPQKVDTGKLWALHNAGWDDKKIADELGVNIKTVRKYLEGGGLK